MLGLVAIFFATWVITALGIREAHISRSRRPNMTKDFYCAFLVAAFVITILVNVSVLVTHVHDLIAVFF